jgi:hypothetical protein
MDQGEVQVEANAETPSLNNGEATPETNQVELEDVIRRETHQRVLTESRKYKQRAVEAEARLNSLEEAQLGEQQKYKELADRYKSELETIKTAKTELQLRTQLIPELSRAGCRDASDALQLGNRELLFGDGDELNGVDDFVKDLQQRKPYLFDVGKPSSVNPSLPTPGAVPSVGEKEDYSKLSSEEIMNRLKALDVKRRS